MADRHVYLRIEEIASYNPVNPEPKPRPPRLYQRDCARNHGHDDGSIPPTEVAARAVPALIYQEYLDSAYQNPEAGTRSSSPTSTSRFTTRACPAQ
jgi:hypothetical protein